MYSLNTTHPQGRKFRDDSLLVRGVYWELPLTGVQALQLQANELTVTGDTISRRGVDTLCEISRTIPRELVVVHLRLDTSRVWSESDVISCDSSNFTHCFREFYNNHTGERFSYEIPFRSYYQIRHVYLGQADTAVVALAFGKRDQDEKKWMGYLLVTKRHPK